MGKYFEDNDHSPVPRYLDEMLSLLQRIADALAPEPQESENDGE